MSDPKQHHDEDDLDLDAETVRDLEPDGDDVRGGRANTIVLCSVTCACPTNGCKPS